MTHVGNSTNLQESGIENQRVGSLCVIVTAQVQVTQFVQVTNVHLLSIDFMVKVLETHTQRFY